MSTVYNTLMADMKEAMKARDAVKTAVLRSLKTALTEKEIAARTDGSRTELSDEAVIQVLMKSAKQRKDSITQFENAGRTDLADIEKAELAVIESYLPNMMSEDEIRAIATEVIAAVGAKGPADMGKVMGGLMPRVKGKADGGLVNAVVKALLG
jgi:uncharacterized protein YqeY